VTFVAARCAPLHLRATALNLAEPPVHRIQGLYAQEQYARQPAACRPRAAPGLVHVAVERDAARATRLAQIYVDPSACATALSIAVGKASIC
jgi:hypothetical protein